MFTKVRERELHREQFENATGEEAFIDAGFTVERRGSVKIYKRPVSDDIIGASMAFSQKRTIGYTSKDIPGRKRCP